MERLNFGDSVTVNVIRNSSSGKIVLILAIFLIIIISSYLVYKISKRKE